MTFRRKTGLAAIACTIGCTRHMSNNIMGDAQ